MVWGGALRFKGIGAVSTLRGRDRSRGALVCSAADDE
jgi:hypothetical protein